MYVKPQPTRIVVVTISLGTATTAILAVTIHVIVIFFEIVVTILVLIDSLHFNNNRFPHIKSCVDSPRDVQVCFKYIFSTQDHQCFLSVRELQAFLKYKSIHT